MIVFASMISIVFFQGCSTDKFFVKKDISSISSIKVAMKETPSFTKDTAGNRVVGALLLGGIGAYTAVRLGGKAMKEQYNLPDFGQLVMIKFAERARKEINNWPEMIIEDQPVEEIDTHLSGTLLVFSVNYWGVGYGGIGSAKGFTSEVKVKMVESGNNLLWEKNFTYKSKEFNRNRPLKEFEADNGKLLKDEIGFAAEETVSDFIQHFKGGK